MVGGSTRVCFLSWSEIPLTYLFFWKSSPTPRFDGASGLQADRCRWNRCLRYRYPSNPKQDRLQGKRSRKGATALCLFKWERSWASNGFRGQKPCTRCRRLGDILLILLGHTVYCEIPTMWCQVGLLWNTFLVHWGYKLSCRGTTLNPWSASNCRVHDGIFPWPRLWSSTTTWRPRFLLSFQAAGGLLQVPQCLGCLGGHGMRGQATRYGGIVKKWRIFKWIYPECMAMQLNNEKTRWNGVLSDRPNCKLLWYALILKLYYNYNDFYSQNWGFDFEFVGMKWGHVQAFLSRTKNALASNLNTKSVRNIIIHDYSLWQIISDCHCPWITDYY